MDLKTEDAVSAFLGFAAVVLGAITALVALLAWGFSYEAGKRKDDEYAEFEQASKVSTAEANSQADVARRDAAQAMERAALLEVRAAEAELALEQLRRKQAPRGTSSESKANVVGRLKNAPKGEVIVGADMFDMEAKAFASQIEAVLVDAGFTIIKADLQLIALNVPEGLGIFAKTLSPAPPHASPIQKALSAVGFVARAAPFSVVETTIKRDGATWELQENVVVIWVGQK